jgi:hypothetical protein
MSAWWWCRFFDGCGDDSGGVDAGVDLGMSNSIGEKTCDSQLSMTAAARIELNFPSLKNTEYVGRPSFVDERLLKQMNHGPGSIGLAANGPANTIGGTSFSSSAAFRRSAVEEAITGAGSCVGGRPSSAHDGQVARKIRLGSAFRHRIGFDPVPQPPNSVDLKGANFRARPRPSVASQPVVRNRSGLAGVEVKPSPAVFPESGRGICRGCVADVTPLPAGGRYEKRDAFAARPDAHRAGQGNAQADQLRTGGNSLTPTDSSSVASPSNTTR